MQLWCRNKKKRGWLVRDGNNSLLGVFDPKKKKKNGLCTFSAQQNSSTSYPGQGNESVLHQESAQDQRPTLVLLRLFAGASFGVVAGIDDEDGMISSDERWSNL